MSARRGLAFLCVLIAACAGGSETGNPNVPTGIALALHSSDTHAVTVASGDGDARIDQAWVSFGAFKFFSAGTCAGLDNSGNNAAPLVAADLATPGAKVSVDLAGGAYCGLVVPLEQHIDRLPVGAPTALHDRSIVVRGKLADGTAFSIEHPEQDELELAAVHTTFDPQAAAGLLLSFDVAAWLDGVDLASATRESDGSVRVDQAHNRALLDAFEANVECSLELYRDADGDGVRSTGDTLLARCAPD